MANILIIARSARALAASAKRADHNVHVMDYFTDEDTKSLSDSAQQLQYSCDGFSKVQLLEQCRDVISQQPNINIVIGTGFEANPELVESLNTLAPVLANSKTTVTNLKDPVLFCEMLDRNGIKHPATSVSRLKESEKCLLKKTAGIGGGHVQWLEQTSSESKSNYYYQEYISGMVASVVFLANGVEAKIVGFNQQMQTAQFINMPFLYQGAMTVNATSAQHEQLIGDIINIITKETGLKGLCGLDYIIDETDDIYVLELNPRPPSTFELHEADESLFDAHLACFDGKLIDYKSNQALSQGVVIFYAKKEIQVSDKINWPIWVKDRPSPGTTIPEQFPVCTIHAEENSIDKLKALLFNRLKQIESTVAAMQNAA